MAEDKANMFRGFKNVSNAIPSASTTTNNQDQLNVCNQFLIRF
jgi:hypothetical protein